MAFAAITPFDTTAGFWYAGYSTANGTSAGSNYTNIGNTEQGWELHRTMHTDDVHDDAFGAAVVDVVNQGSEYIVTGIMINLTAATAAGVFNAQCVDGLSNNAVGLLGSAYFGSLVLTPLPGTPAAKLLGAGMSIVFGIAAIANDYQFLLSSKQRKVSVTFKVIPDQNNGNKCWYIASTSSTVGSLPTAPPI